MTTVRAEARLLARRVMRWAPLWLALFCGALAAAEKPAPAPSTPDAELLDFLAAFETKNGQWPELHDALAKPVAKPAPPSRPTQEEAKR